ncbi:MAG: hypothetical protein LBK71_11375, partial [Verrucomicrobiales bacterium]|nr:hypothetical protein [Verrucomicrobiales bacterium]
VFVSGQIVAAQRVDKVSAHRILSSLGLIDGKTGLQRAFTRLQKVFAAMQKASAIMQKTFATM